MSKVDLDKIMPEKILVVEDEPALLETLAYNLERYGYLVETISNGIEALETARREIPDLIILDVMLPGIDGFEITRILRKDLKIPILMLTARDDEIDRVLGLELGADDYLTKPFSMRELLARVKAQLRRIRLFREEMRAETGHHENILTFDNLEINMLRREVKFDGKAIPLRPKEYDLLLFMCENQGKALSRDFLLDRVWGWDFSGGSRTVDVHIRWLRGKFERDPGSPKRIVTVRGVGYRFEG